MRFPSSILPVPGFEMTETEVVVTAVEWAPATPLVVMATEVSGGEGSGGVGERESPPAEEVGICCSWRTAAAATAVCTPPVFFLL